MRLSVRVGGWGEGGGDAQGAHYEVTPGMFSSEGAPKTFEMSSICSASVLPANSGRGSSSSAMMQPADHMSISGP